MSDAPFSDKQVLSLLTSALDEARKSHDRGETPGQRHANRSRNWVEGLAKVFRNEFEYIDRNVRVFSKYCDVNRFDFTLNELLFDVCVAQTAPIVSAAHGMQLRYICKALWQIESEFASDSKQALADFNKLVLGSAENKLFIGPRTRTYPQILDEVLLPVANCCKARVFAALVPHPADWDSDRSGPELYVLNNSRWQRVPVNELFFGRLVDL